MVSSSWTERRRIAAFSTVSQGVSLRKSEIGIQKNPKVDFAGGSLLNSSI